MFARFDGVGLSRRSCWVKWNGVLLCGLGGRWLDFIDGAERATIKTLTGHVRFSLFKTQGFHHVNQQATLTCPSIISLAILFALGF